ncbi:unnamed protein product [Parajaminaea phylloscopi]
MYQHPTTAESASSIDLLPSTNRPHRESRIQSIYEKYLYDPKDLDSPDPVIRALARKHSQQRRNNNAAAAGNNNTMSTSARANKKGRASVMFAKGTKGDAAVASAAASASMPRNSTGSAYDGFGALMDAYSDDSDDSDSEERVSPAAHRAAQPPQGHAPGPTAGQAMPRTRESWGARALAVGERPPDSMSQNPPTLKLLALKSQREGGPALGGGSPSPSHGPRSPGYSPSGFPAATSRANPPMRNTAQELSVSEYGDSASRVGSTIDFTGHGSDGFGGGHFSMGPAGPREVHQPQSHVPHQRSPLQRSDMPLHPDGSKDSSRKALTAELGLDTPQPHGSGPPQSHPNGDYFTLSRRAPQGSPEKARYNQQPAQGYPQTPQNAVVRQGYSSSNSSGSLASPASASSSDKKDPFEHPSPPTRALVVGPQGMHGGPMHGSPQRAMAPPHANPHSMMRQPPQGPGMVGPTQPPPALRSAGGPQGLPPNASQMHADARRGPPTQMPVAQKRQSIFRRSMAFMAGNDANWGNPQQQRSGPSAAGAPRRQSIFRRSMAFLSGKPMAMPEPEPEPVDAPENHPAPRVRGFENEKDALARRSQYLGGGGKGAEWDVNGAGAKFWARFDQAQKHAESNDKMERTSRTFRQKVQAQKKLATCMAGLGGVIIIGGVVGIVIWRESGADNTNANPGAINKGEHGGTDTRHRRAPVETGSPHAWLDSHGVLGDVPGTSEDLWANARVERGDAAPLAQPTPVPEAGPVVRRMTPSKKRLLKRHGHLQAEARLSP